MSQDVKSEKIISGDIAIINLKKKTIQIERQSEILLNLECDDQKLDIRVYFSYILSELKLTASKFMDNTHLLDKGGEFWLIKKIPERL